MDPTGDGKELIKAGAEAFFKPFSDLITKLGGPLAEEIGMTFGDAARVYRYKRALRLLQKVGRYVADAGYEPAAVRPKLLLPILDHASVEDDDGLHDRWAALVANASNPAQEVHVQPSFPEILAQLSSKEAVLLDHIQLHVDKTLGEHYSTYPQGANWAYLVDVGTWRTVLQLYAELNLSKQSAQVLLNFTQNRFSPETNSDYAEFRVAFDNLIRLGLLREDQTKSHSRPVVHLTALGYDFVLACRPPKSASAFVSDDSPASTA